MLLLPFFVRVNKLHSYDMEADRPLRPQLWKTSDLSLVGVLRGHKRGVWAIEFSPVDKCIASASGDQTVRLWSVTDFSCIKTLEGHTSSVLCVKFMRLGTQLMSGGADGIMKLWNIRESEVRARFAIGEYVL